MKMIFVWLILGTTALARLGETTAQIEARYGKAVKTDTMYGMETRFYNYQDMAVMVIFMEGKSGMEGFAKKEGEFSDHEVALIMTVNSGGKHWELFGQDTDFVNKKWRREDGEVLAIWNTVTGNLTVSTKNMLDAANATVKDQEERKLKGL